jgi:uncharacterized protein YxjI
VLDNADRLSSRAVFMSTAVELLEGPINSVATHGVYWGFRFALVADVSHFVELKSKLELLGSGRKVNLTQDEADALWTRLHVALDTPASYVPSSVAYGPPDGTGE